MRISQLFAALAALLLPFLSVLSRAETAVGRLPQAVVADGPVKVTTTTDKPASRVADPIQLTVKVEAPRGARIKIPTPASPMKDFEVQDSEKTSDIPSPQNSDEREWTLMLTLETIKTGELTIPSLDVHYALNAKEAFKTLHTAPIQIHIASVLEDRADPKQFRDIKPTVDVPVPPSPSLAWITWTAAGTGALAVAVLLTVVVVRRRRRGPAPADWALAAIEDLEQLGATGTNDGAVVFNDVVDIVREYFELEFNVPTLPRTTREFLAEASEEIALPQQTSQRLKWMASVADEIKFARLSVSDQHVQQAFAQAKAFIAECELYRQATIKGAA